MCYVVCKRAHPPCSPPVNCSHIVLFYNFLFRYDPGACTHFLNPYVSLSFSVCTPFEYFVLLTIVANCITLGLEDHLPNDDKTPLTRSIDQTEIYFLCIFTVEATVKILAMGFLLHPGSYLRNGWNIMDFVVVVSGFLTIFMSAESDIDLRTLRAFRVLRPLKLVSGIPSLQVVLKSILKAMLPLLQIGVLVLFAIVIFAIVGLEFYNGAFHPTCFDNITQLPIPDGDGTFRPCGLPGLGGRMCGENAVCTTFWIGPNYGITSFDNIFYSMLTVFQCITMEGWTDVMYYTNDAMGNQYTWIYFIPLIVIGSFFMLNLVLGVLSGEFAKERESVERRQKGLRKKQQKRIQTELEEYLKWICQAEEIILHEARTTEEEKQHILEARRRARENNMKKLALHNTTEDDEDEDDDDDEEDENTPYRGRRPLAAGGGGAGGGGTRAAAAAAAGAAGGAGAGAGGGPTPGRRAPRGAAAQVLKKQHSGRMSVAYARFQRRARLHIRRIIKTQTFYWIVITLVFLNTACVAVEHAGQPQWLTDFLHFTELGFLSLFTCETFIKMYGLTPKVYFKSTFNVFDCIVIIGSIFEVIWSTFKPEDSFGISIMRALRLLRIFKVTPYWKPLRNLVVSLMGAITSITSLLFLLFLFLVIFALLGMQLFGGKFNFEEGKPAAHFDTFAIAMLTAFQILTGENWNEAMYIGIRSHGGIDGGGMYYAAFYIVLVLFGNYTLLNVFLAIAVDNLAKVQDIENDADAAAAAADHGRGGAGGPSGPAGGIEAALLGPEILGSSLTGVASGIMNNMHTKPMVNPLSNATDEHQMQLLGVDELNVVPPSPDVNIFPSTSTSPAMQPHDGSGRRASTVLVTRRGTGAGGISPASPFMQHRMPSDSTIGGSGDPAAQQNFPGISGNTVIRIPSIGGAPVMTGGASAGVPANNIINLASSSPAAVARGATAAVSSSPKPPLSSGKQQSSTLSLVATKSSAPLKKMTSSARMNIGTSTASPSFDSEGATNTAGGGPMSISNADTQIDRDDQTAEQRTIIDEDQTSSFQGGESGTGTSAVRGPKPILPYRSLFVLRPANPFRRAAHNIVNLRYFDFLIMVIICASSVTLALEDPINNTSERNKILNYLDYGFTVVFTFEMVLKIIDLGLILHPGSYFRDTWNILDATVVICALIAFGFGFFGGEVGGKATSKAMSNLNTIKSLRVLRVLRPLKTINRVPKLKAVFDCVVSSLRNVVSILIVYFLFQFIFAVIAVQLFKGRFWYCTDETKLLESTCKGYYFYNDAISLRTSVEPRLWRRHRYHYDNVPESLLTLYTISTGEGWPKVLKNSIDSTHEFMGPLPTYRLETSLFYIVYFVVFPFFFVNIFVALIIITFQEQGEKELIEGDLDKNQKSCIDFAINARPICRYMPQNKSSMKYQIWKLVVSPQFEYFVLALIGLNTIVLMCKTYDPQRKMESTLSLFNGVFTGLFAVECVLKMCGFGIRSYYSSPSWLYVTDVMNMVFTSLFTFECLFKLIAFGQNYFKDQWNTFDFTTVVGSITDVLVSEYGSSFISLSFLRLFRAARLVKLLRQGYTIRLLLWTFMQSFKALPYVILLILMLFFVYSIIGMQLFGNIAFNMRTSINRHNNFQHFFAAILLLFRCATGEDWQLILYDTLPGQECAKPAPVLYDPLSGAAAAQADFLLMSASGVGGGSGSMMAMDPIGLTAATRTCGMSISYLYFVTFIFFCNFLMLNLFVAVIMDNFDYLTRDSSIMGPHHLDEFVRCWSEYDPTASGWIHHSQMYKMLREMPPPLGFGQACPYKKAYWKLIHMNMPIRDDGTVNFTSTLFALIRVNLQIKTPEPLPLDGDDPTLSAADKGTRRQRELGELTQLMDRLDEELRQTLRKIWPMRTRKLIKYLVPFDDDLCYMKLTTGKVYAALLILENIKVRRSGVAPKPNFIDTLLGAVKAQTRAESHTSIDKDGLAIAESRRSSQAVTMRSNAPSQYNSIMNLVDPMLGAGAAASGASPLSASDRRSSSSNNNNNNNNNFLQLQRERTPSTSAGSGGGTAYATIAAAAAAVGAARNKRGSVLSLNLSNSNNSGVVNGTALPVVPEVKVEITATPGSANQFPSPNFTSPAAIMNEGGGMLRKSASSYSNQHLEIITELTEQSSYMDEKSSPRPPPPPLRPRTMDTSGTNRQASMLTSSRSPSPNVLVETLEGLAATLSHSKRPRYQQRFRTARPQLHTQKNVHTSPPASPAISSSGKPHRRLPTAPGSKRSEPSSSSSSAALYHQQNRRAMPAIPTTAAAAAAAVQAGRGGKAGSRKLPPIPSAEQPPSQPRRVLPPPPSAPSHHQPPTSMMMVKYNQNLSSTTTHSLMPPSSTSRGGPTTTRQPTSNNNLINVFPKLDDADLSPSELRHQHHHHRHHEEEDSPPYNNTPRSTNATRRRRVRHHAATGGTMDSNNQQSFPDDDVSGELYLNDSMPSTTMVASSDVYGGQEYKLHRQQTSAAAALVATPPTPRKLPMPPTSNFNRMLPDNDIIIHQSRQLPAIPTTLTTTAGARGGGANRPRRELPSKPTNSQSLQQQQRQLSTSSGEEYAEIDNNNNAGNKRRATTAAGGAAASHQHQRSSNNSNNNGTRISQPRVIYTRHGQSPPQHVSSSEPEFI